MQERTLNVGEIVQLSPFDCRNKMFGGCYMTITEPKSFGAMGFIQALGQDGEIGGHAYYRARWEEMEETGGIAVFVADYGG